MHRKSTTKQPASRQPAPEGTSIIFDCETRDFAAYLDGELVGFAATHAAAEQMLDELVYRLLSFAAGWDAAVEAARAA